MSRSCCFQSEADGSSQWVRSEKELLPLGDNDDGDDDWDKCEDDEDDDQDNEEGEKEVQEELCC